MEGRDSAGRLGISSHVPRCRFIGDDMPKPGECEEQTRLCQIWWPDHLLLSINDQGDSITNPCSQFCSGSERDKRIVALGDVGLIVGWKLSLAEPLTARSFHVIVATVVYGPLASPAALKTVCDSLRSHSSLKELHSACGSSPVILGEYSIGTTTFGLGDDVGNGEQHQRERGWKWENDRGEVVEGSKCIKANNVHVGVGSFIKQSKDGHSPAISNCLVKELRLDGDAFAGAVSSTSGHGCQDDRWKNGFWPVIEQHNGGDGYQFGGPRTRELGKPIVTNGSCRCADKLTTETQSNGMDGNCDYLEEKEREEGGGKVAGGCVHQVADWRKGLREESDLWLVMEARSMREVGTGKAAKGFPWLLAALASGKHLSMISQIIVYRQPRYGRHHYSAQRKWNPFCHWNNEGFTPDDQKHPQGQSGTEALPRRTPEWLTERERKECTQGIQMEHVVVQLNSSRFVERMVLSLCRQEMDQLLSVSGMPSTTALSVKLEDETRSKSMASIGLQVSPNVPSGSPQRNLVRYDSNHGRLENGHVVMVNNPGNKKQTLGKVKRTIKESVVDPCAGKEGCGESEGCIGWRISCILLEIMQCFVLGILAVVVALAQAGVGIVLTMLLPFSGLLGEWSDTWHAVVHRHAELSLCSMALKSCLESQLSEACSLLGSASEQGIDRKADARISREAWDVREAHLSALRSYGLQAEMLADMVLGVVAGILLRWQRDLICQLLISMGSDLSTGLMKTGMVWLMGVPAGFKLNNELANCTGRVSLYLIHGWATLCSSLVVPVLPIILDVVAIAGLSGLSVLLSLLGDLLALATCHMAVLYGSMAVVYTPQLQAAGALWRMFRGQKRNPLRHRVDSYECSVEQSLVGCLMFTPLLLLLPTTSIFYIFFTVTYGAILAIRGGLRVVLAVLRGFPFFAAGVWLLLGRGWFPSGMWFRVLELEGGTVSSGLKGRNVHVSNDVAAEKMVFPNSYLRTVEVKGNGPFEGRVSQGKSKVSTRQWEVQGRVLCHREGHLPKSRLSDDGGAGPTKYNHVSDGNDHQEEARKVRDRREREKKVGNCGGEERGVMTHMEMLNMDGTMMEDGQENAERWQLEQGEEQKVGFGAASNRVDCLAPRGAGKEMMPNRKDRAHFFLSEPVYIMVNCNGASFVELLSPFLKYIGRRFHTRFLGKLAHDLALGNRIQPLLRFADERGMRWSPASFCRSKS